MTMPDQPVPADLAGSAECRDRGPRVGAEYVARCVRRPGHRGVHSDEQGVQWSNLANTQAAAPAPADLAEAAVEHLRAAVTAGQSARLRPGYAEALLAEYDRRAAALAEAQRDTAHVQMVALAQAQEQSRKLAELHPKLDEAMADVTFLAAENREYGERLDQGRKVAAERDAALHRAADLEAELVAARSETDRLTDEVTRLRAENHRQRRGRKEAESRVEDAFRAFEAIGMDPAHNGGDVADMVRDVAAGLDAAGADADRLRAQMAAESRQLHRQVDAYKAAQAEVTAQRQAALDLCAEADINERPGCGQVETAAVRRALGATDTEGATDA